MLKLIMQPTTRHDSREKPFIISSSTNIEIDCCMALYGLATAQITAITPAKGTNTSPLNIFCLSVMTSTWLVKFKLYIPFTFQCMIYPMCLRCQYEKRKKSEFHLLIEKGKHLTVQ